MAFSEILAIEERLSCQTDCSFIEGGSISRPGVTAGRADPDACFQISGSLTNLQRDIKGAARRMDSCASRMQSFASVSATVFRELPSQ